MDSLKSGPIGYNRVEDENDQTPRESSPHDLGPPKLSTEDVNAIALQQALERVEAQVAAFNARVLEQEAELQNPDPASGATVQDGPAAQTIIDTAAQGPLNGNGPVTIDGATIDPSADNVTVDGVTVDGASPDGLSSSTDQPDFNNGTTAPSSFSSPYIEVFNGAAQTRADNSPTDVLAQTLSDQDQRSVLTARSSAGGVLSEEEEKKKKDAMARYRLELAQINSQIARINYQIEQLEEENDELRQENEGLEDENEGLAAEIAVLEAENEAAAEANEADQHQRDLNTQSITNIDAMLHAVGTTGPAGMIASAAAGADNPILSDVPTDPEAAAAHVESRMVDTAAVMAHEHAHAQADTIQQIGTVRSSLQTTLTNPDMDPELRSQIVDTLEAFQPIQDSHDTIVAIQQEIRQANNIQSDEPAQLVYNTETEQFYLQFENGETEQVAVRQDQAQRLQAAQQEIAQRLPQLQGSMNEILARTTTPELKANLEKLSDSIEDLEAKQESLIEQRADIDQLRRIVEMPEGPEKDAAIQELRDERQQCAAHNEEIDADIAQRLEGIDNRLTQIDTKLEQIRENTEKIEANEEQIAENEAQIEKLEAERANLLEQKAELTSNHSPIGGMCTLADIDGIDLSAELLYGAQSFGDPDTLPYTRNPLDDFDFSGDIDAQIAEIDRMQAELDAELAATNEGLEQTAADIAQTQGALELRETLDENGFEMDENGQIVDFDMESFGSWMAGFTSSSILSGTFGNALSATASYVMSGHATDTLSNAVSGVKSMWGAVSNWVTGGDEPQATNADTPEAQAAAAAIEDPAVVASSTASYETASAGTSLAAAQDGQGGPGSLTETHARANEATEPLDVTPDTPEYTRDDPAFKQSMGMMGQ